jgi:hypothetical protein
LPGIGHSGWQIQLVGYSRSVRRKVTLTDINGRFGFRPLHTQRLTASPATLLEMSVPVRETHGASALHFAITPRPSGASRANPITGLWRSCRTWPIPPSERLPASPATPSGRPASRRPISRYLARMRSGLRACHGGAKWSQGRRGSRHNFQPP